MKKGLFTCIVFFLFLYPACSLDCRQIVTGSDRSNDPFLLELLFSQDLTGQICIVESLGQRADPYVEDYIYGLVGHMDSYKKDRYEYLLRVLLFSVFHPGFEPDELAARIEINKRAVMDLIARMHVFHDPVLKCQIMWLIPYAHDLSSFAYCLTEGDYLLSVLKQTKGMPDIAVNEEIICLLETVQQIGNRDYLFLCQSIIELSRVKRVVDMARTTIKILLEREKE